MTSNTISTFVSPGVTPARDRLLDTHQLAKRWNVSARTLERHRTTGDGPRFLRVGGAVRYRLADIEAYENQQLAAAEAERAARAKAGAP
jgi:predicted DNA-binding transcriptional regulator AlpA